MSDVSTLKLYILWDFLDTYYGGLAFAIAESEEEAREMIAADAKKPLSRRKPGITVHPIEKFATSGLRTKQ